jgi:hypothetical protein
MSKRSDVDLQNLLASITDSLLSGDASMDQIIRDQGSEEILAFIRLIDQLGQVFVPVTPSSRFVRRLRQDMIGTDSDNVLVRVRRLPPRVHIAAGLALVAGFVILRRRRGPGESDTSPQEAAAAQ